MCVLRSDVRSLGDLCGRVCRGTVGAELRLELDIGLVTLKWDVS